MTGTLYSLDGSEIMDVSKTSIDVESEYVPNQKYEAWAFPVEKDICLEINNCEINPNIQELFGIDHERFPASYEIEYIKLVQARHHKKKRINKKWLKRYGYKQIRCKSNGWELQCSSEDGTFEFVFVKEGSL